MKWFYKRGELKSGQWDVLSTSLAHTGLRVGTVSSSLPLVIEADKRERALFILDGGDITVAYGNQSVVLRGRSSVFDGPTDHLYVPIDTSITITGQARVAIGEAPATQSKPASIMKREDVPVFIRGAGRETRQIHNFGMPDTLDADRLIVVEVIVPAGNWSGAPAHKHDVYEPGKESNLEEIYYFESAVTRGEKVNGEVDPVGYFRGYASDDRPFEVTAEVRSGDVVLVPHGWHGPVAAGPGYDLYFFNIMAGPDPVREWNVTDDPHHSWIRESWKNQEADARLPYGRE
jgi:5-deoxy-glucuronate isomerase